eukprot:1701268-Rhodomonas_salina.1
MAERRLPPPPRHQPLLQRCFLPLSAPHNAPRSVTCTASFASRRWWSRHGDLWSRHALIAGDVTLISGHVTGISGHVTLILGH